MIYIYMYECERQVALAQAPGGRLYVDAKEKGEGKEGRDGFTGLLDDLVGWWEGEVDI